MINEDFLVGAGIVMAGAVVMALLVFWLAQREYRDRFSKDISSMVFAEFRWTVRNDLVFFRDLLCSPVIGIRMACRAEDRRRRAHRRATRNKKKSDA